MHKTLNAFALYALFLLVAACGPGNDPDAPAGDATTEAPTGQLPAGVVPTAYRLDLTLDPRRDDFSGEVAIDVVLDAPTDHIWLHGKHLDVASVAARTAGGSSHTGTYTQVLDSGVSVVRFDSPLPAGAVTLTLGYSAAFDRNLAGLFKVVEQGDPYVLAKSESIQARSYLPGFDEPGLKATFDITLTIPRVHEAIGNAPVVERRDVGDDMQRLTFATTPPMSTYLLSLAVGPFDIVERPPIPPNAIRDVSLPLRGVARRGRGGELDYVLDVTPRMVEIFEQELQQPYPFRKLDIVAAPQWPSGATELSAAITYREQRLFVGDVPAPGARRSLLRIHAHEIAHMWFGNLVTPPWWDDLWLKEGFATWSTPVALTLLEPDAGHELDAAERALGAMALDSLASTRAIREPIEDNDEIRNAYDSITYSKSLGVIHMIDQFFGPETFRPALGRYIETFAGGSADSPAFYRVIGEETNTPELTETFRGFVEQTGVPLVALSTDCSVGNGTTLTLRQGRYKALGSPIDDADKTWNIPVCVRSDGTTQCTMMTIAEQTLDLDTAACPQWVMPNAAGSGYYRWTLDDAGWAALTEHFAQLTPVEAMSAIDSAFAMFEAGGLDAPDLLDLVAASSRSPVRQVVTAPLSTLADYASDYLSDAARTEFLAFTRTTYQPTLERTAGSDDPDAQLLHSELIRFMALAARDPDARTTLRDMAFAFTGFGRDVDDAALPSDLYYPALAVAIEDAGAEFLPHLLAFRAALDDPAFGNASADAIGHVGDPELLDTVHELALTGGLGPRETFDMMRIAMSESALREQHWRWLQGNFPALVDNIPTQWRRRMPRLGASFCSPTKRTELERLVGNHASLVPGYRRSLAQALERIDLCIGLKAQAATLAEALGDT